MGKCFFYMTHPCDWYLMAPRWASPATCVLLRTVTELTVTIVPFHIFGKTPSIHYLN